MCYIHTLFFTCRSIGVAIISGKCLATTIKVKTFLRKRHTLNFLLQRLNGISYYVTSFLNLYNSLDYILKVFMCSWPNRNMYLYTFKNVITSYNRNLFFFLHVCRTVSLGHHRTKEHLRTNVIFDTVSNVISRTPSRVY